MQTPPMNAVVLAGGELDPQDPLVELLPPDTPRNKAFVPLAGISLIQHVVNALSASTVVRRVIIVGQDESAGVHSDKPLLYLPDHGSLVGNLLAGVEASARLDPADLYTLLASADTPLISAAMVDWVAANTIQIEPDIAYHVITDQVMEARFPGANRTYVKMKGVRVCGADLNTVSNRVLQTNRALFERLAAARKNPLRQAAIFGPGFLLGVLLGIFDPPEAARHLGHRLGLKARAVFSPYAEMGMDIDKPEQYRLVAHEFREG